MPRRRLAGKADITGPAADINLMVSASSPVNRGEPQRAACLHPSMQSTDPSAPTSVCRAMPTRRRPSTASTFASSPGRSSLPRPPGQSEWPPRAGAAGRHPPLGGPPPDALPRLARRQRFAFVNLDACMASQAVTFTVIARLKVGATPPSGRARPGPQRRRSCAPPAPQTPRCGHLEDAAGHLLRCAPCATDVSPPAPAFPV